jgi:hypothetical protein
MRYEITNDHAVIARCLNFADACELAEAHAYEATWVVDLWLSRSAPERIVYRNLLAKKRFDALKRRLGKHLSPCPFDRDTIPPTDELLEKLVKSSHDIH